MIRNNFNLIRRYLILPVNVNDKNSYRCYSIEHQQQANSSDGSATNTKSSVDEEEMRRFKGLSHSWWIENGGEFEALHKMNK